MTKAELIEAMKDMPDDMHVNIWFEQIHGWRKIKKVETFLNRIILIEPEDE